LYFLAEPDVAFVRAELLRESAVTLLIGTRCRVQGAGSIVAEMVSSLTMHPGVVAGIQPIRPDG